MHEKYDFIVKGFLINQYSKGNSEMFAVNHPRSRDIENELQEKVDNPKPFPDGRSLYFPYTVSGFRVTKHARIYLKYFFLVPLGYDYMKWVSKNYKNWPALGNKWKNWDTEFKLPKAQSLLKLRAKSSSRRLTSIQQGSLPCWDSRDLCRDPIFHHFAVSFTHFSLAVRDNAER